MNTRKRYGKEKWIQTGLSAGYRRAMAAERFYCASRAAIVAAQGLSVVYAIRSVTTPDKAVAMLSGVTNTVAAISKISQDAAVRVRDIKAKYGVVR